MLAQFTNHPTSVIGGGQIGYNWQFPGWGWGNGVVAGIEADIQGASKSRSKCLNFVEGLAAGEVEPPGGGNEGGNGNGCGCPGGNGNGNGNGNGCGEDCQGDCGPNCQGQDNSWFGTMRGRAGVAFDRVLPYVTGGWAFGHHRTSVTCGATGTTFSTSKILNGWTVGGGVEWAFWDHWTAKLEYLYIDLGKLNNVDFTLPGAPFTLTNGHFTENIARVGVSYKFW